MEPPAKRARHGEVSSSAVDEALDSCSGHGRLVTTCHHAMLRTERERFDQRFVARHGSIAPAPTKKYVKHQAFKKNCRTCAHKWGVLELAIKRAAFPDHGACGKASIALRRARKVCTLCAARALSRFLFSVENRNGYYHNNSRFKRPVRVIKFFIQVCNFFSPFDHIQTSEVCNSPYTWSGSWVPFTHIQPTTRRILPYFIGYWWITCY